MPAALVEVCVAANCCWAPEEIVTVPGETLILPFELLEEVDGCTADEIPAQLMHRHAKNERRIAVPSCWMKPTDALPFW